MIKSLSKSNKSYVLVTGGLGFIGSHVVIKLFEKNMNIIILDNLSNSDISVLDNIIKIIGMNHGDISDRIIFIEGDILDSKTLNDTFEKYLIETVMHFAALKSVNESQLYPEKYYQVNVQGSINLLNIMKVHSCKNFIYSSSATVYGDSISPVTETSIVGDGLSCNYAKNKYFMEKYLIESKNEKYQDWNIIILRYFNPIGAHPSGLIGENPKNIPNNIFPYLLRVAKYVNSNEINEDSPYKIFTVFGKNYNTDDGTCIRDYVHVQDLAKAHVNVLKLLKEPNGKNVSGLLKIYNVGTGVGTSVLQLIEELNKVLVSGNKKPIIYKFGDRRPGDIDISYANVDKIYNEIQFKTEFTIATMCKDGLNFIGL